MAEKYFGITDTGKQRDNNEDAFIAESVLKNRFIIACVIDGVGGYEGGEVAAAIARKAILDYLSVPSGSVSQMLREAVVSANEKIYKEKIRTGKHERMACVLTTVLLEKKTNKFYYAHVGDTRLYLLRDQSLVKLTKDQSFVGLLEDSGRLNEMEAMSHPKRNEINRALGFQENILNAAEFVETGESPFLPGDLILLCSDGLTDMVNRKEMTAILTSKKSLEEKGRALVDAANEAGGKDNITVVLVQNTAAPVKLHTKPKAAQNTPVIPAKDTQATEANTPTAIPEPQQIKAEDHPRPKKNTGLVALLVILCLVFLGGFIWQWMKNADDDEQVGDLRMTEPVNQQTGNELQDILNASTTATILLPATGQDANIFLNGDVVISQDSLRLNGSGSTVLTRNKNSPGLRPVIRIDSTVEYVLFDSLTIRDTDIQIHTANFDALHFRNVRLQNARVQVAYPFMFTDSLFTGTINDMQSLRRSKQNTLQ